MRVFISHSSVDREFASRLEQDLRSRAGAETWLDRLEIGPGEMVPASIEQGLLEADVFLLLLSPDSVNSRWVEYERQAWLTLQIEEEQRAKAEGRPPGRRLVPVLYRECEPPPFVRPLHYVRIGEAEYEIGFGELLRALSSEAPRPPAPPSQRTGVTGRKLALNLLKQLLSAQFEEVVFLYECPRAYLPAGGAQVERAIALIEHATQQEGPTVAGLLEVIWQAAPALRLPHV